jgi:hypothetical protein
MGEAVAGRFEKAEVEIGRGVDLIVGLEFVEMHHFLDVWVVGSAVHSFSAAAYQASQPHC